MSYHEEDDLKKQQKPKPEIRYETFWQKCADHDFEIQATYLDGKLIGTTQTGRTRPAGQHNSLENY